MWFIYGAWKRREILTQIKWKSRNEGDFFRDRIRLEENININLREIGFEGVNLIYLIKDSFLCLKLVNAITNFSGS
jgi:hypothetical protein